MPDLVYYTTYLLPALSTLVLVILIITLVALVESGIHGLTLGQSTWNVLEYSNLVTLGSLL